MRKYKIIIVENDEDEQLFMKEGFDVTGLFDIIAQVRNGDILFDWLKKNSTHYPNLILSDLNMPGKNGYDIITEMKLHHDYAAIPVIIMSTSSTKTIIDKCMALGAADYVVKPELFIEYTPFVKNLHTLIQEKHLVK